MFIEDSSSQGSREESLGQEENLSDSESLQPRQDMMIMQRARFQYQFFLNKRKQDSDEWIEDFISIAQANEEDAIKLSTLVGVLRGEARP